MQTPRSRLPEHEADQVPPELIELARAIAALPDDLPDELQSDVESSYDQVVQSMQRRRRILGLVQEALAQLRLDVKYLMFDLEMTRRERDELRQHFES